MSVVATGMPLGLPGGSVPGSWGWKTLADKELLDANRQRPLLADLAAWSCLKQQHRAAKNLADGSQLGTGTRPPAGTHRGLRWTDPIPLALPAQGSSPG